MKETTSGDFKMVAKTLHGLEEVLAGELLKLGARDIEKYHRAVGFTGDTGFMYKANLSLRTALRILKPIASFDVFKEEDLYMQIKALHWEDYMKVSDTLAVDSAVSSSVFNHSQYVSQRTKDAIVDRFREKYGKRPSVDLDHPHLRVNVHLLKNTCTLSLDSSGESLHKRGYRDKTNIAPLNEVLAAGMVLLSEWDKRSTFIDPMCGSGTTLIEAALIANNIPPGYFRKEFGFELWQDFDPELWNLIYESAINKISNHDQRLLGSDISRNNVKKAKENVKLAKVDDSVVITTAAFQDIEPPPGRGTVIINPPYGERMNKDDILELYKTIGDTLKKKYAGYSAWVLSSNTEAIKKIGLHATRKITLFNGALECKFLKYQLYEGSKKIHKLNTTTHRKQREP